MPIHYDYITAFLHTVEGKAITKGYVPTQNGEPIQNSGVTIGTGVDLGQQTKDGLLAMGVPPAIVGVLVPYLGLKRHAAIAKLKELPLTLSTDAVAALDSAVIGAYVDRTATSFDRQAARASDSGMFRFADRPKQVQAVTVSLRYQFGNESRFPKTWSYLVTGDYPQAIRELENPSAWNGNFMNRRRQEAALLREISDV